jgi:ribonuclease J
MSLTAPQPNGFREHDPDALYFLPLGGSGEIGMNLNLYGYRGQWLIVDCGVTFGEEEHQPGVDVIMADPAFIVERRDRLLGILATHGHEDHIGAIPYLWPQLQCPIWATPFTASLLRTKLTEAQLANKVKITTVDMSSRFTIGPFDLELITLTHSIPEPNAVVIRTSVGTVLHTGDWKLDPDPLIGSPTDEARLRAVGDEGVLAIVCDSTNALRDGTSGSEGELRQHLTELIGQYQGRIAVACFASNVARLSTIAHAAAANDRDVALIGRSLWRMDKAARENGYLADVPRFLTEDEAGYVPRDKIVLICTGSQGEPRAALARIARDDHPHIVTHHPRQRKGDRPAAQCAVENARRGRHGRGPFRARLRPPVSRRADRDVSDGAAARGDPGAWRSAPSARTCRACAAMPSTAGGRDRERRCRAA